MGYKFKVEKPKDLYMPGNDENILPGTMNFEKLQADPSKYADYINARLEQDDFDPSVRDVGQDPMSTFAGGSRGMFEDLAKKMLPGVQKKMAEELRSDSYKEEAYAPFRRSVLSDLAQSNRQLNQSLSRRGIGFGGLADSARARLNKNAAGELAAGKADISSASEAKAKDVEANSLNFGIQQRNLRQQMFNTVYNSALQSYMQRKSGNSGLLRGLGMIAGGILGSAAGPAGTVAGAYAGGELGGAVGGAI